MLITDSDALTRMPQCALGKTVLAAQRISPHVAQQRCAIAQQFVQVAFDIAAFVADRYDARHMPLWFGGRNARHRFRLKPQLVEDLTPCRVIWVATILLNDQCIAAKPRMTVTEPGCFLLVDWLTTRLR